MACCRAHLDGIHVDYTQNVLHRLYTCTQQFYTALQDPLDGLPVVAVVRPPSLFCLVRMDLSSVCMAHLVVVMQYVQLLAVWESRRLFEPRHATCLAFHFCFRLLQPYFSCFAMINDYIDQLISKLLQKLFMLFFIFSSFSATQYHLVRAL